MAAVENLVTDHLDLWTAAIKRKSAAGRGSSSKVELYGIKKLRELILELAVRGLLVPQDPNDEPASELLKKIAADKAKLFKEGKIKKEKPLPPITDEEVPFHLPKGWSVARLSIVSTLITKGTTPTSVGLPFESFGVNFIKIENIENGRVKKTSISQFISEESNRLLARSQLEVGDLLFSIAGTIGKTAVIFNEDLPANTNQALAIIRGTESVFLAQYLRVQLDSFVAEATRQKARGGAMPNVSLGDLNVLVSLIPPLADQHRIVAKVDELMALCDQLEQQTDASLSAHQTLVGTLLNALTSAADNAQFSNSWQRIAEHFDTLFTTEESIAQLKQTLLQLAVMGKLVPQDPNDEPASELLKKMAAERTRSIKEKTIRNSRPLAAIADEEKFMPLPAGWVFARLNDVGDWGAGATPSRNNPELYGGGIPWFKSGELVADYISQSEETVTELALEKASLRYNKVGDVLIAMYGATIGRTAILAVQATTNQAVCACTPFSGFENTYLLTLLKAYRPRFIGMGAGGAQPNISREKIIETVVAVPPNAEQFRIVAKVDELMALCDQLKSDLGDAQITQLHLADTLTENALARA